MRDNKRKIEFSKNLSGWRAHQKANSSLPAKQFISIIKTPYIPL